MHVYGFLKRGLFDSVMMVLQCTGTCSCVAIKVSSCVRGKFLYLSTSIFKHNGMATAKVRGITFQHFFMQYISWILTHSMLCCGRENRRFAWENLMLLYFRYHFVSVRCIEQLIKLQLAEFKVMDNWEKICTIHLQKIHLCYLDNQPCCFVRYTWLCVVGRAVLDSLEFSEVDSYHQATVKIQFSVKMEIFSPKILSERESQTCGRFMSVPRPVDRKWSSPCCVKLWCVAMTTGIALI
jgi:hypothetical protein